MGLSFSLSDDDAETSEHCKLLFRKPVKYVEGCFLRYREVNQKNDLETDMLLSRHFSTTNVSSDVLCIGNMYLVLLPVANYL